ncbi:hypothetical protein E5163_02365 [Marinicauda algicola]|uniref:Cell division protein FtsL n=1 Tax=Marinicauda algicola TaxID=2029849 RepID=A0A4S2H363_9PROT|nr:hypothetical protein [Marinicauda algicola]TGY89996.1 hypothetical protein E5163_02365 [Marinicauda algicola]
MMKAINLLGLTIAVALLLALYIAKTEAGKAQDRLANLQAELAEERGRINTLQVNVAHLEDPEQLRALARAYLGFEPIRPNQEIGLNELPSVTPETAAVSEGPAVPQTASVRRTGGRP